jgi:hypothetical protein
VNNIKLLKAQSNLALTQVDPRLKIGIENYISALEAVHEASVTFANNLHVSSNPEMAEITLEVDPQDLAAFEKAVCLTRRAADASPRYVIQNNRYVASRR